MLKKKKKKYVHYKKNIFFFSQKRYYNPQNCFLNHLIVKYSNADYFTAIVTASDQPKTPCCYSSSNINKRLSSVKAIAKTKTKLTFPTDDSIRRKIA